MQFLGLLLSPFPTTGMHVHADTYTHMHMRQRVHNTTDILQLD